MKKILKTFLLVFMFVCLFGCEMAEHEHEASRKYASNETHHWHTCKVDGCDEKLEREKHTMEDNFCTVCGYEGKGSTAPEHEHEYKDEYKYNETAHWQVCIVEGCYEKGNLKEHKFSNPDITYEDQLMVIEKHCLTCNYQIIEEHVVESTVDSAVEWNQMFQSFKLTNFSMNVCFLKDDNQNWIVQNHCEVDNNAGYYNLDNRNVFYTEKVSEGVYTTFKLDYENNRFVKLNDTSDTYYKGVSTEAVLQISFADNYENFTYNKDNGTYECAEMLKAEYFSFEGESVGFLYCFNIVITVVDGKINTISADYTFEDDRDEINHFEYYNIGTTIVKIPDSIITNAVPEGEE